MKLFAKFNPCYARPIHVKKLPNQSRLKKSKLRNLDKFLENIHNFVNYKFRNSLPNLVGTMPVLSMLKNVNNQTRLSK